MIIPEGINVMKANASHPDDEAKCRFSSPTDTFVVIRNGELLQGALDKAILGTSEGGLVHTIYIQHSPQRCRDFINSVQRVIRLFIQWRGFSIGYSDTIADRQLGIEVDRALEEANSALTASFQSACAGTLPRDPGQTMMAAYEALVNR